MRKKINNDDFPIKKFKIQNYRSFIDSRFIEIKPLTILIGPNNSGKSSIYSPLLALKQTIECDNKDNSFETKGKYVSLGLFEDIKHKGIENDKIKFTFCFSDKIKKKNMKIEKLNGKNFTGAAEFVFCKGESGYPELDEYILRDLFYEKLLSRKKKYGGKFDLKISMKSKKISSKSKSPFIKYIIDDKPEHFCFTDSFFSRALSNFRLLEKKKSKRLNIPGGVLHYLVNVGYIYNKMQTFLDSISFIGPIRVHPKRYYERNEENIENVGLFGENTANIIYHKKDDEIFMDELIRWLKKFELAIGIKKANLKQKELFSLLLKDFKSKKYINYADMGFGASQLLPLIVQGLVEKQNKLIIAEQPEIHLNPKLQTKVCDLLCAFTNDNKYVLLETHSEHILLRLRTLIAKKIIKSQDVGLYFVEKNKGYSEIKKIEIEPDGHIDSDVWPEDFFDDGLIQAMKLTAAQIGV